MATGELGGLPTCEYAGAGFVCVQELGDTGGTPFGSCGGDGTPPVYWVEEDGQTVLVATDGFFTPDGYSNCACHDGTQDANNPPECCCPCGSSWPPP
jgi:hypothetical protein